MDLTARLACDKPTAATLIGLLISPHDQQKNQSDVLNADVCDVILLLLLLLLNEKITVA